MTAVHKFVLPGLFVLSIFDIFFLWGPSGNEVILPAVLAFALFYLWLGWGLKYVAIDSENRCLRVSNYREEIRVPFSEIADVREFIFAELRRVTVELKHPSKFGSKLVFLGTYRFGGLFAGAHPIVAELRSLTLSENRMGPR